MKTEVEFIGRLIAARRYCLRSGKGNPLHLKSVAALIAMFDAHKNRFSENGFRLFVYNNSLLLRRMCTGGKHQASELNKIIEKCENHVEYKETTKPRNLAQVPGML